MAKKPPPPSSEGGAPEWMISYADIMTTIMAFFVVLYAFSSGQGQQDKGHSPNENEMEVERNDRPTGEGQGTTEVENTEMDKVIRSLYDRFGPNWTLANSFVGRKTELRGRVPDELKATPGDRRAKSLGRGQPIGENSTPLENARPAEFTVPGGRVFFKEFSADLAPSQKRALKVVAGELAGNLQKIEVRGHTSRRPLPPNSPFKDHWDLAYARCRAVADYLEQHGVDPQRIRIATAGENEPIDAVGHPPYGEKNSRVEIRLLHEWIGDPAKTSTPASRSKESKEG